MLTQKVKLMYLKTHRLSMVSPTAVLASEPSNVIFGSFPEKEQCIELGFVKKLIELWRKRRKILEAKAEISVSGVLANYTYRAGKGIMNKTLSYRCSYLSQLFKSRNRDITMVEKQQAALTMYKASLQQCDEKITSASTKHHFNNVKETSM